MAELVALVEARGLTQFAYRDDRGGEWMEIRPSTATFRVPFYGYRTHLLRMIVDQHMSYWLEAVGHCVRSGSLRSVHSSSLDPAVVIPLLDSLNGGLCVCQVMHCVIRLNSIIL